MSEQVSTLLQKLKSLTGAKPYEKELVQQITKNKLVIDYSNDGINGLTFLSLADAALLAMGFDVQSAEYSTQNPLDIRQILKESCDPTTIQIYKQFSVMVGMRGTFRNQERTINRSRDPRAVRTVFENVTNSLLSLNLRLKDKKLKKELTIPMLSHCFPEFTFLGFARANSNKAEMLDNLYSHPFSKFFIDQTFENYLAKCEKFYKTRKMSWSETLRNVKILQWESVDEWFRRDLIDPDFKIILFNSGLTVAEGAYAASVIGSKQTPKKEMVLTSSIESFPPSEALQTPTMQYVKTPSQGSKKKAQQKQQQ